MSTFTVGQRVAVMGRGPLHAAYRQRLIALIERRVEGRELGKLGTAALESIVWLLDMDQYKVEVKE